MYNQFERPVKVANLDKESASKITRELNCLLANEYALFTKTLNYHWNITGPRFHSLHKFLERHYKDLLEMMDDLAERVRVLGKTPHSTVKSFANAMGLDEKNGKDMSTNQMLSDLFTSHVKLQSDLKDALIKDELFKSDPGTEDFLISLLRKHEKMGWMLRSHLD